MKGFRFTALATGIIALVLLSASPAASQEEVVGRVNALTGVAVILRDGTAVTTRHGTQVRLGDRIVTYEATKLEIAFDDGANLILGSGSTIRIHRYGSDGEGLYSALLRLLDGIVRLSISDTESWRDLSIETQMAVASARSTSWIVDLGEDATAVFVVEGSVDVSARGRTVRLSEGQGSDIRAGEPPGEAKRWGAARVQDVLARTSLSGAR